MLHKKAAVIGLASTDNRICSSLNLWQCKSAITSFAAHVQRHCCRSLFTDMNKELNARESQLKSSVAADATSGCVSPGLLPRYSRAAPGVTVRLWDACMNTNDCEIMYIYIYSAPHLV